MGNHETNRTLANLLAGMEAPDFPVALGVLYCAPADPFERVVHAQAEDAARKAKITDLNELLRSGPTWTVS